MTLSEKTKKILAKEFLFALGTVILFYGIIGIYTILENRNSAKVSEVRAELDTVTAYDALPYRLKLYKYIRDELPLQYTVAKELGPREDFLERIKKKAYANSVLFIVNWEKSEDIPLLNFDKLLAEDVNADLSGKYLNNVIIPLEDELYKVKSSFFNANYASNSKDRILYSLLFILFGLRYIFHATKWSLRQLRQPTQLN